ncbi:MAG: DNA polymerase III subunit epsilon [Betaproteobacteria bacterium]|jgi:DNA polymerase-3 subunit epsilon|nr:DNA polymerase III subunit epsilon [Betaproteobacteria bacterium]MDH4293292.1 DNA polymerase III subunit epsilon [Betaproteobacteria bacterium]MDH5341762.1 DNA polymerase III subunit epsilon [Betaproteobacteria bacterium]
MPVRQIILDTETTGLDPKLGHRIIEIAGVELIDRRLSGKHFHRYVNPGRDSDEGALQVHGLTTEFLSDKPKFSEIAAEFLDYVGGAELIIHNAPFDVGFIDAELALMRQKKLATHCPNVIDTLRMAKELHPGKRNSLDALCDRYQIDNSARTLHGALLDAELLAEVYLAMTRGQESLMIEVESTQADVGAAEFRRGELTLAVLRASPDELAIHEAQLADIDKISGAALWRRDGS